MIMVKRKNIFKTEYGNYLIHPSGEPIREATMGEIERYLNELSPSFRKLIEGDNYGYITIDDPTYGKRKIKYVPIDPDEE